MDSLTGSQIIGQQLSDHGDEKYRATSAFSGEPMAPFFRNASEGEVDRAVCLARDASGFWATASPDVKSKFLRELAQRVNASRETLLNRASLETGYPEPRLTMELDRSLFQLGVFANLVEEGSWVDAIIDQRKANQAGPPQPDLRRMLRPVGPVGVFGACNFPFAISVIGNDVVSAWAAGCPVVVKGHPGHPGTCELLGRCVQDVIRSKNLPEGIFSLVQGTQNRVGEALVQHPSIRAIGFTGSLRGGKSLWALTQKRTEPIPFFAELGSLNPTLAFPAIFRRNTSDFTKNLLASLTIGNGQMCTRPGFVFYVKCRETEQWTQELLTAASLAPQQPLLNTSVASQFAEATEQYRVQLDARQIFPLQTKDEPKSEFDASPPSLHLYQVTAAEVLRCGAKWTEAFGPVCILVGCKDLEEMKAITNTLPGGLTLSLHADPAEQTLAAQWLSDWTAKFGRIVWNDFPTGVPIGNATQHGGPYPASFDGQGTSIGTRAIERFARPTCYQNFPETLLPPELQSDNPRHIWRQVDGRLTQDKLPH